MAISVPVCQWNNVAQRAASIFADAENGDEGLSAITQAAAKRPWRSPKSGPAVVNTSESVHHWRNVASRMASAFNCSDTESDWGEVVADENACALVCDEAEPLRPAPRGDCTCLCYGEVLQMCGHYGWLVTDAVVDHPDVYKNNGRIYVHRRDVANGVTLQRGDLVVFYLYVDSQGLGAEDCRLQEWDSKANASGSQPSSMNPSAAVFVPVSFSAFSFPKEPAITLVPGCAPAVACALAQSGSVLAVNAAYWSDSDDSSEESSIDPKMDAECEGDISDCEQRVSRAMNFRRPPIRRTTRKKRASSHGSSSTQAPSDSDRSSRRVMFRPPPGLDLPQDCAPPPGLRHPGMIASV